MNTIGIEIAHGFGDCLFAIPLIESLCKRDCASAIVAVESKCADAFIGVPCIKDVVSINHMGVGHGSIMSKYRIDWFYQITPNHYFQRFKDETPDHSLTQTITSIGKMYDVEFDARPKLYLSDHEHAAAMRMIDVARGHGKPVIAIEAEYLSSQSWASQNDFERIISSLQEHTFLWMSKKPPTFSYQNLQYVADSYTRRECIAAIGLCDEFISVGSGLFCGLLTTAPSKLSTVRMLWTDDLYRYKGHVNKWLPAVHWYDNAGQWDEFVDSLQ